MTNNFTKNPSFNHSKTSEEWQSYQLDAMRLQIEYAKSRCLFYENLPSPEKLQSLSDITNFPFTSSSDIISSGIDMVCINISDIRRIVTLRSSGTSGSPKRLYFSENDLKRTEQFFSEGMQLMCSPGDSVIVFMPGESDDGIGRLLARGLQNMGEKPVIFGPIPRDSYAEAAEACRINDSHTIVGIPSQMRKLALLYPEISPENVLLSADYISESLIDTIERIWKCNVFTHYGLTESGLGCAVECNAHEGMHIRQDELYIEIIDPVTLKQLPVGEWGEIVMTTLRREAMPLIRYRTGDIGRLIPDRCKCGSGLARLDRVRGRILELVKPVSIMKLDDVLFGLDFVLDYSAVSSDDTITVYIETSDDVSADECIVKTGKILKKYFPNYEIHIAVGDGFFSTGTKKRAVTSE